MKTINQFRGEYAFLSNFYFSPLEYEDEFYATAEHAFQASKTRDEAQRRIIRKAKTPGEAKRLGRTVDLRPEWDDVKLSIMRDIVFAKFGQSERLKQMLLETGDAKLVEDNKEYWGMRNNVGQNHLGKILMEVRKTLKEREDV